jgi:hypothetical protein
MPRLNSDPITAEDLSLYLETSDFQLEIDVFRSLLAHGAIVSHGGTYTDPVTKKDRQYDIRAEIHHGIGRAKFAVECKNLKPNYPLLISRVPRMSDESYHHVIMGRSNALPKDGGDIFTARGHIFRSREPVGKTASQVGKAPQEGKQPGNQIISSDSETYDKWAQAIASSHDLVRQSGHSSIGDAPMNVTVVLPVLVVPDNTLWVADYSAEGALVSSPRQINECSLFLGKLVAVGEIRCTLSHLLIFTKSGLDAYLMRICDPSSDDWEYLFPDNKTLIAYERGGSVG